MIVGLILAGGASSRMGTPKALLKIGEETFLQRIVRVLHSAQVLENFLVLGSHAEQIQSTLLWFDGKIMVNEQWEEGQISSIKAGIAALADENIHGILLCPVDHPLLTQALLVDLLQGFWKSNKNIIIPTFNGQRGHPVIFSKAMFGALLSAPLDEGAKYVVHQYAEEILEVPVDDEAILLNVDTPEDYKTMLKKLIE